VLASYVHPDSKAATNDRSSSGKPKALFPQTEWTAISDARGQDFAAVSSGLRQLATSYWRPLYLYLRKQGETHDDASDTVQGFFEFVLSSDFLSHVDREGGKFRSYLLKSLERWRNRQRTRDNAQKRGGQITHVPLDGIDAMQIEADSSGDISPEAAFDKQWATDIVHRSLRTLKKDYERRGREIWFEKLQAALPGASELPPYVQLAAELDASEGAVKKAVFDLRGAFAASLREEIRTTVRSNEDAEEELRYLVSVMSGQ
jgi:DNA-directed RNA polymerase specialized sigma24 family protein